MFRRERAGAALFLTVALALSGCSGSSDDSSGRGPSGQPTANGLTLAGTWPLTGLPAQGAAPRHPVMVVKIDNTESSSPQIGLSKADLVTEELVEGGATRLAVFFYQHTAPLVGPVRSMRATDIGIVEPAKAVLVASGGAPPTVRRIRKAGIKVYAEPSSGFRRDASRRAPYNLFVALTRLAKTVSAKDTVESYLPFGKSGDTPAGQPARRFSAVFSTGHTTSWAYRGGRYENQNSFAAAGDRFRPDNVLVLRVRVGDAGYKDPAGNPVPETKFTGTGQALLFSGGQVVRGTWTKKLDSTISLDTKAGELSVPAGHTWIELVPVNGGSVRIGS
jgi:Protein of unknown function (DUF3048) N-terminal domain/Protein of unknown function (DUF3048) C-terminal domain